MTIKETLHRLIARWIAEMPSEEEWLADWARKPMSAVVFSHHLPAPPIAPAVQSPSPAPKVQTMSDVTALAKGELTAPAFVVKVVGELTSNPIVKAMAPFVLMLLEPQLVKLLGSSTTASAIIADITAGLEGGSASSTMASTVAGII